MSAAHTPGPWVYSAECGENVTEAPCITTVARCAQFVIGLESDVPGGNYRDGDPSGDEESDARLISAAPDLLEAAKLVLAWYEAENDHTKVPDFYSRVEMCLASEIALRAAIAKATGGAV